MDISLLMKVAGVGFLIATSALILNKSGRDEQAMLLTITGIIVVMVMLIGEIGELLEEVRDIFGI
ncbi:MAG: stage III sporulation protein AC [Clostridia bacterium]|nr:stage III sporulation protein AC [Clostridia bacterium]MBR2908515.1 stage III sporulation protein AC [Clostridia bacterium]